MLKEIKEVDPERGIIRVTTVGERWYVRPKADKRTGLPDYEYVPSSTWIASHYPKSVGFYKWLASKGWDEAESIKEAAGGRGTRVHKAIETLLRGGAVPHNWSHEGIELAADEYAAVMSFAAWFRTLPAGTEVLAAEYTVWNEQVGYAGTVDLKLKLGGEVWIIDVKTSQNVWPEHELQLSSYRHADPDCQKTGIIQVGYLRNRAGYKFTEIEDKFPLFLAARTIWSNECAGARLLQKEYPLEVSLRG